MIRGGDLFDVVKVHPSAECKTIRIAVSAVKDGCKGHTGRRVKEEKLVSVLDERKTQKGTWEVRNLGEDGWSRGESTSRNPEKKKGHPYPSVLEKFYKMFYQEVEIVPAISTKENSISKCFFLTKI